MNPTSFRTASRAAMRQSALRARAQPLQVQRMQRMRYSSEAPSPVASQGLVLGALALLGIGGYIYLKPVRDVATKLNTGIDKAAVLTDSAKDAAGKATSVAKDAAGRAGEVAKTAAKKATDGDAGDGSLLSLATTALSKAGPGLAGLATAGGLGGILSKLKDVDISGALDLLKATGSDEIGKVVDIVQKKVKDVDGKVEDIDWRALATELNEELGGKYKSTIDMLVGKIPSVDDFNDLTKKLKAEGKDKLKDLEAAASKVYKNVETAAKDQKNAGDAFVAGIKATSDDDLDALAKALKGLCRDAGLPADTVVDYARDKAKDGAKHAEQFAKQVQDKFDLAAKWLPVDEETAVKAASDISPSLGKMVKELLDEAKEKAGQVKDLADKGKKAVEDGTAAEGAKTVAKKGKEVVEEKVKK